MEDPPKEDSPLEISEEQTSAKQNESNDSIQVSEISQQDHKNLFCNDHSHSEDDFFGEPSPPKPQQPAKEAM